MTNIKRYAAPLIAFAIFVLIGFVVWIFRDIRYFYLFSSIGLIEFCTRVLVIHYPKTRQFFRILIQAVVGGFLLLWLGVFIGVNFQFPQLFFDMSSGIITGTLIQLLIARLLLPFFFGNAFCSRACWTGFFFEISNSKKRCAQAYPRKGWLAWMYLITLIIIPLSIVAFHNPAESESLRRMWIIGENLFIITIGFLLTFVTGSRSYCRLLCPFITLSSIFAKFSLFKITPMGADTCVSCNACNEVCPMLIDIQSQVHKQEKVSDTLCIVCERCVSACPKEIIELTFKKAR